LAAQDLERVVGVGEHVGLAADRREERPIRSDDECGPFRREWSHPFHPEELRDGPIRIGQEREVEAVLLVEFALSINLIGADSRSLGSELGELAGQVAEVAAFLRSAGRHGLGVEEQHDGTGLDEVGQVDRGAVLVGGGEVGNLISDVHENQPTGDPEAAGTLGR
jgi:hypothetical protein